MKWDWNEFWVGVSQGVFSGLGFILAVVACIVIPMMLN